MCLHKRLRKRLQKHRTTRAGRRPTPTCPGPTPTCPGPTPTCPGPTRSAQRATRDPPASDAPGAYTPAGGGPQPSDCGVVMPAPSRRPTPVTQHPTPPTAYRPTESGTSPIAHHPPDTPLSPKRPPESGTPPETRRPKHATQAQPLWSTICGGRRTLVLRCFRRCVHSAGHSG